MKLMSLISQVNEEKPNGFSPGKLVSFVNEIESQVMEELNRDEEFEPYEYEEDSDVELVAPMPYDRLYKSYLKAQIDYSNEEYESYTNNLGQFNQDYADFVDWCVREKEAINTMPPRFKNIF